MGYTWREGVSVAGGWGRGGRGGLERVVRFPWWLGCWRQRGAIAAPAFPRPIPCHEFVLAGARRCALGWQVGVPDSMRESFQPETLASMWEQKGVTAGVLYAALVKWSLKGTMETPSAASFAPVFLNKNIAAGWISVKTNIVLIKMLQEVGFVNANTL